MIDVRDLLASGFPAIDYQKPLASCLFGTLKHSHLPGRA
jgi:hypothetical protein